MSEREIKKGSIWRNCIAEVEVTFRDVSYYYPKIRTTFSGGLTDEMDERVFRATHEWVRDPAKPLPECVRFNVGHKCPPMHLYAFPQASRSGHVELIGSGFSYHMTLAQFEKDWEPCDPPPLHAALRAAAAREPYPGHCEAERVLNEIAALYRKGER